VTLKLTAVQDLSLAEGVAAYSVGPTTSRIACYVHACYLTFRPLYMYFNKRNIILAQCFGTHTERARRSPDLGGELPPMQTPDAASSRGPLLKIFLQREITVFCDYNLLLFSVETPQIFCSCIFILIKGELNRGATGVGHRTHELFSAGERGREWKGISGS